MSEIRVTPRCCDDVEKHQAVFLVLPESWKNGDTTRPKWSIECKNTSLRLPGKTVEVTHCPFCGEILPEIIRPLISSNKPIRTCIDGGDCCNTCHQKLIHCCCLPPESAWGPNTYDPNFGDCKLCKCGHQYHRHFDSYENMSPVGCKYCRCNVFQEDNNEIKGML